MLEQLGPHIGLLIIVIALISFVTIVIIKLIAKVTKALTDNDKLLAEKIVIMEKIRTICNHRFEYLKGCSENSVVICPKCSYITMISEPMEKPKHYGLKQD